MFVLLLSLVSPLYINLIFSIAFLIFFISNFTVFLEIFSLVAPCFVFNFNSRKRKQTIVVFDFNTKSTSKINNLNIFYFKKIESRLCYSLGQLAIVTPSVGKCSSWSNYTLILRKFISYLQANPFWLKKNINSLDFISVIIKQLMTSFLSCFVNLNLNWKMPSIKVLDRILWPIKNYVRFEVPKKCLTLFYIHCPSLL